MKLKHRTIISPFLADLIIQTPSLLPPFQDLMHSYIKAYIIWLSKLGGQDSESLFLPHQKYNETITKREKSSIWQ